MVRRTRTAALAGLAMAAAIPLGGPATAMPGATSGTFRQQSSGLCAAAEYDTTLTLSACTGTADAFAVSSRVVNRTTVFQFRHLGTGLCVATASIASDSSVGLWACNSASPYQQWLVASAGDGVHVTLTQVASRLSMDTSYAGSAAGTRVVIGRATGSPSQRWAPPPYRVAG